MGKKDIRIISNINKNIKDKILNKIRNIDSDYFKRYILRIFKNQITIQAETMKYNQLISLINNKTKNNKEYTLIDLGGCHGFLSYLLTKYTNNEIIMLEPFNESVSNCKKIWPEFVNDRIKFINGNYENFIALKKDKKPIKISHILSYDVIEHVGDIENFIKKEKIISQENKTKMIHCTAANPYNLRNKLRDIKLQLKYEYLGNNKKSMKSTSSVKSYFYLRLDKYNSYQKHNNQNKKANKFKSIIFSFLTRGLTKNELQDSLSNSMIELLTKYIKNLYKIGIFNTIDIQNDSWMERHHNLNYLKKIIQKSNSRNFKIIPTKYIYTNKNFQNSIKKCLNYIIDLMPLNILKLMISPAIIITYNY